MDTFISITPKAEKILEKIDFYTRYEALVKAHDHPYADRMPSVKYKPILEILGELGYRKARYYHPERYIDVESYKFPEGGYLNFLLVDFRYSSVDIDVAFKLQEGSDTYCIQPFRGRLREKRIAEGRYNQLQKSRPSFKSYEELAEILQVGCEIYEDIKREVFALLPPNSWEDTTGTEWTGD